MTGTVLLIHTFVSFEGNKQSTGICIAIWWQSVIFIFRIMALKRRSAEAWNGQSIWHFRNFWSVSC